MREEQAPAHYRLRYHAGGAYFGFAASALSWKPLLFPSRVRVWRGERGSEPAVDHTSGTAPQPYALLGVRSCDLHAIGVHDRVLAGRATADPDYAARRAAIFVVAVACSHPGGTCFCASMGTGPRPDSGYDLALVELVDGTRHDFLVEVGSALGAALLAVLPHRPATADDEAAAARVTDRATVRMGRPMDTSDIRDLLYANAEHPRWDDGAARCLTCGNCTLVCPTCFCTTVEDVTDLIGERAERWRVWDSCFTLDFSYLHGGSVRTSSRSRYRQWLTPKLAAWHDQFGTSGCVGCGRCITWCPAAIDITEEVAAIRAAPTGGASADASPTSSSAACD